MKINTLNKIFRHGMAGLSAMYFLGLPTGVQAQTFIPGHAEVPYFEVPGGATEVLPLKSTSAKVRIAGVIAHVTVSQVYQNRGNQPVEAVYVFPGSTRSAVHAMQMKIGSRTITARIETRDQAQKDYNAAVKKGRTASLLEQQRPNVFEMHVGNIMPGDLVEVEIAYTETLQQREGVYEFVYPTVAGPRYHKGSSEGNGGPEWNANPWLKEGELPAYTFDLDCSILSGLPLREVRCTSHQVEIDYTDRNSASVKLGNSELHGGNRDFILQYRIGGEGVESGVWLYSDGKENFFMASIQPPARMESEMIPPREYIFIVDVSGSMYGFPLQVSKKLISGLLNGLKPSDQFNILFFSGGSAQFARQSVAATGENISAALRMLDGQQGGGGTELLPALKQALSMKASGNYARTFVIATDGYVTVEKEAFELIRTSLNEASFFSFGIGSSVNRFLIEGLAHAGAGESCIITSEQEATEKAGSFLKYISSPLLTGVNIAFNEFMVDEPEPASVPDLFASRPVVIFGKYRGKPQGSIVLSGKTGKGDYEVRIPLSQAVVSSDNEAIKYLWAREQIRRVDDYAGGYSGVPKDVEERVTGLGLRYNLLTSYTSFVAVDSLIRNDGSPVVTVRQPLPLPEGVSDFAVAQHVSGVRLGRYSKAENSSMGYAVAAEACEDIEIPAVYSMVEMMPSFKGGESALERFISKNLKYPEEARKNGISGDVIIEFIVNADGSLSGFRILKKLGYGCDEEALRVIRLMPAWNPGKQNGRKVKTKMVLPVNFS
ncbi:TonB family protein [Lentimicrobium sp.]|uniref:TonB family protein n=1 Tax=Lentimicrobium sp. TaxID=2034841 RepID=UPI002BADE01E|nr:TonB family protein [Lentimicrobium sp.]HPR25857.1 TonB family protein [Lentimicrobium sp.]HRW68864.1 TonB family protein [Lentimicrobium sp.]